jgi:hypothetical protein
VHPVNAVGTVRWNAAFAYLDPARRRPNLTIADEAVADTVAKYVSEDALPAAQLVGDESLHPPGALGPADSIEVEFVVFPNGVADTSSVVVTGARDPRFVRSAVRFAAENRFTPAQVSGCSVVSRYSVIMRSGGSSRR